jgi:hypothetical protein
VEASGNWPYDPAADTITSDPAYAAGVLERTLGAYGFGGRWAYWLPDWSGRAIGPLGDRYAQLFEEADVLVNLTGGTELREEHLRVPCRVYLETDPVASQIAIATGDARRAELVGAHTHQFSFGENLGRPGCGVPVERFSYRPTRQPVVLDWWEGAADDAPGAAFTTVGNWRQDGRDIEWSGEQYTWSKHDQFERFVDLPSRTAVPLELALSGIAEGDAEALRARGWRVVEALPLSLETGPYRDYLCGSLGEFTVAKDQNVRLRSGWFSDRSACYLAAGRPVVTQDTAFDCALPTGEGLFAVRDASEAAEALEEISSDYPRCRAAARRIAEEHFRAEDVLQRLVDEL